MSLLHSWSSANTEERSLVSSFGSSANFSNCSAPRLCGHGPDPKVVLHSEEEWTLTIQLGFHFENMLQNGIISEELMGPFSHNSLGFPKGLSKSHTSHSFRALCWELYVRYQKAKQLQYLFRTLCMHAGHNSAQIGYPMWIYCTIVICTGAVPLVQLATVQFLHCRHTQDLCF